MLHVNGVRNMCAAMYTYTKSYVHSVLCYDKTDGFVELSLCRLLLKLQLQMVTARWKAFGLKNYQLVL